MISQCFLLYSENSSRQRNYPLSFDNNYKQERPLQIFVIDALFVSVRDTDLHLNVGRPGLGAKLNVTKSQV